MTGDPQHDEMRRILQGLGGGGVPQTPLAAPPYAPPQRVAERIGTKSFFARSPEEMADVEAEMNTWLLGLPFEVADVRPMVFPWRDGMLYVYHYRMVAQ